MCFDSDGPSVFNQLSRKARKEHRCCECQRTIVPGETYEFVHGLWEGCWQNFKTCSACVHLRAAVEDIGISAGCHCGETVPPFGYLMEAAVEDGLVCVIP